VTLWSAKLQAEGQIDLVDIDLPGSEHEALPQGQSE
jgi:hypothetical protein